MTSTVTNEQWITDWHEWHASREEAILAPHGVAANTGTTWLSDDPQIIAGLPGEWGRPRWPRRRRAAQPRAGAGRGAPQR